MSFPQGVQRNKRGDQALVEAKDYFTQPGFHMMMLLVDLLYNNRRSSSSYA